MLTWCSESVINKDSYDPLSVGPEGWLSPVHRCASPNYSARPDAASIDLLVIHNISLPPEQFGGGYVQQFFCNQLPVDVHPYFSTIADLQVSAHCMIDRLGEITQFVSFAERAWHAGQSCFGERKDCNDFSIGVELEGSDHVPYTEEQYQRLTRLTRVLMTAYPGITEERIVGHSDIAPGRKTDPGPAFDWAYYFNLLGQAPCI